MFYLPSLSQAGGFEIGILFACFVFLIILKFRRVVHMEKPGLLNTSLRLN